MKYYIPALILALVTTSCKKDKSVIPALTASASNYFRLEKGNYWIYETTQFGGSRVDSSTVTKDTVIRNNSYVVVEGHNYTGSWQVLNILRDSSNYIVNHLGVIQFALENFTDTLNREYFGTPPDTFASVHYKMFLNLNPVNVPAGQFDNTLNYRGEVYYYDNQIIKYNNYYYKKDVGLIHSIVPYARGSQIEKKLIRYKVQE